MYYIRIVFISARFVFCINTRALINTILLEYIKIISYFNVTHCTLISSKTLWVKLAAITFSSVGNTG